MFLNRHRLLTHYLHVLLVDVVPQVGELPVTVRAGLGLAAAARTGALHTRVRDCQNRWIVCSSNGNQNSYLLPHLDLAGAELSQLLQLVGGVAQLGVGVGQLQITEVRCCIYCRYHGYCRYCG